ncbi:MAG TPA: AarF/ABC1/UbiB kinase family protein [Solirubrobacteraceae bacterium]|jgi:predicted unusual protein kinase regulating ubiquinone biosynthesis (AarF/ABC1/UbiB family)
MPKLKASIPAGRLRRGAQLGRLLGVETARTYVAKAANVSRSEEAREATDARRRLQTAEHVAEVLGQMKGGAMKVGQMASLIDFDRLPADELDDVQTKLAELRNSAPQVPFKEMQKVVEHDLGERIADLFADFDPDAAAAASIGQVYRARLHDGRDVAVKVQYPGIASAVRADIQNLGLLIRAARRFAPGLDPGSTAVEVRERITEELDYEHEAQAQRAFARRYRDHPFIVIPDVITELCRERVLVTEWVDGIGFDQLKAYPKAKRDRVGEIVFRFYFGSLYRFGHFSGDPHPGNFVLRPDGRVAFLDFGMTKIVPRGAIETELEVLRAALEMDARRVHAGLAELGFFDPSDPQFDPARVLAHVRALNAWYATDEPVTLTPRYVSRLMVDAADPRSEYWDLMRNETMPANSLFSNRMQAMTLAGLGQLEATANWHRVMSEWLYGSPPSCPLGIAEADFFRSSLRSLPRAA